MSDNMEIRFGETVRLDLGNTIPVPVRDYLLMVNKPQINGHELVGNFVIRVGDLENDAGYLQTETDPTVPSWAKEPQKPIYTAEEVHALPDTTFIPSKESDLENDRGYYIKPVDGIPLADLQSGLIPTKVSQLENDSRFYVKPVGGIPASDIDAALIRLLNGKMNSSLKGAPNGVAELDQNGMVPSHQLPSYVDDVKSYTSIAFFPAIGEDDKIYVDKSTNLQYRWGGTDVGYITIGTSLALGETANTAYRGDRGKAAYDHAIAKGQAYSSGLYKIVTNSEGHVVGAEFVTKNDIIALGFDDPSGKADKADTVLETTLSRGRRSGTEVGVASFAFGNNVAASGYCADATGSGTNASGDFSHAEGRFTTAYSDASHAEGSDTVASSESSHAEGVGGTFTVNNSEYQSGAYTQAAHSEGNKTRAQGLGAHSEGEYTVANSNGGHAEGIETRAIGYNAAHAEGSYTLASDDNTHAEGYSTIADNDNAHAEGSSTHASGVSSHAEGSGTNATGSYAHAEGNNTNATGNSAHSEGYNTNATGNSSHAEGSAAQATANYAHSEGLGAVASGEAAHAEGSGTQAIGMDSHAEGAGSRAIGMMAHAEGVGTAAQGYYSHAEGGGTQAIGNYAHTEGAGTRATGSNSHAEGANTVASGICSHVEGSSTIAAGSYSHVIGLFNVVDSYDSINWPEWTPGEHCVPGDKRRRIQMVDEHVVATGYICKTENTDSEWDASHWLTSTNKMNYVVIVGNGAGDNERSNAYTLDWDGNGRFAGDVYIRCNPDGTGGVKLAAPAVDDVRIDGTSILQNGIADIPLANGSTPGVVKTSMTYGFSMVNGCIALSKATDAQIKAGNNSTTGSNYRAITPGNLKPAVFYGLADSAGDSTQKNSNNAVGTYTDEAKQAIQKMLGLDGILGDFESSAVASKAYAIGETFVYNGKRYRATAAIAISDVIAPGTNCELDPLDGDFVKRTDIASSLEFGVVKVKPGGGTNVDSVDHTLIINRATDSWIKAGTNLYAPIVPASQHTSVFYALSKLAGVNLANETVTVGTYPQSSKTAIQTMLGIEADIPLVEEVSGSTPTITGMPNVRYICGTCSLLTITPPASGSIVVRFTSGSTPTVLTVPNAVKFPVWFDYTSLEADTTYEIIITDGVYGGVMSWAA